MPRGLPGGGGGMGGFGIDRYIISGSLFRLVARSDKKIQHARIIWSCAWSGDDKYFATASRDKKVSAIRDLEPSIYPTPHNRPRHSPPFRPRPQAFPLSPYPTQQLPSSHRTARWCFHVSAIRDLKSSFPPPPPPRPQAFSLSSCPTQHHPCSHPTRGWCFYLIMSSNTAVVFIYRRLSSGVIKTLLKMTGKRFPVV